MSRVRCRVRLIALTILAVGLANALPSPGTSMALNRALPSNSALRGGAGAPVSVRRRWSPPLVATIGMASILWGYDQGVLAAALLSIVPEYKLEKRPELQGMVAAASTVGTMIGSSSVGPIADLFGRKIALLCAGITYLTGALIGGRSKTLTAVVLGRLFSGMGIGISSVGSAMYAAECAPASSRGKILTVPQMLGSTGFTFAYIRSVVAMFRGEGHHAILSSTAPGAAVLIMLALAAPETPRWLLANGRIKDAKMSVLMLRNQGEESAAAEVQVIADAMAKEGAAPPQSGLGLPGMPGRRKLPVRRSMSAQGLDSLKDKNIRGIMAKCLGLHLAQQFSGINAVLAFGPRILKEAQVVRLLEGIFPSLKGREAAAMMTAQLVTYAPKLLLIYASLMTIDILGRRFVMLTSTPIIGVCLVLLGGSVSTWARENHAAAAGMVAAISLTVYGSFYSVCLGALPNMVSSELLPTRARGAAMSALMGINSIANVLVVSAFPALQGRFGTSTTLLMYAMCMLAATVFFYLYIPETTGISLEQLAKLSEGKDPHTGKPL